MSRTTIRSNLLDLLDSDSDDGFAAIGVSQTIPAKSSRPRPAAKKPADVMPAARRSRAQARPTATASKVTKPAAKSKSKSTATATEKTTTAASRRASARLADALEKEVEARDALAEKSSNEVAGPTAKGKGKGKGKDGRGRRGKQGREKETEEDDEDPPQVLATPPESYAAAKPTRGRGRPKKTEVGHDKEIPDSTHRAPAPAPAPASAPAMGKKKGGRKLAAAAPEPETLVEDETEIPETQQPVSEPMDLDDPSMDDSEMVDKVPGYASKGPWADAGRDGAVPGSALRGRTGGSGSGSGSGPGSGSVLDAGEPALRRRLGEMTKKYESLELRYRHLRDVAVRDAERNFDKLKKQGEEKAKTADQLVASLKSELAVQREMAREAQRVRRQLDEREVQRDELQAKVTALTKQLATAQAETKALSVKLTASRNNAEAAAAAAAAATVPGSAMKRSMMLPAGGAAAAQVAQMKEDLYGDLTGLIVRGVKKEGASEHVYDCIQTGRNGTLHFKLSVGTDPSSDSYDEAQFVYMPQLDPGRDRALVDVLPDYLAEEITFPRPHANKFYARVMKALTERQE